MNRSGKIWGTTTTLFNKNNVEIHRLEINKNGYCSKHKHTAKFNMFYVESGEIKIAIERSSYDLTDQIVLKAGETTIVKPGEKHWFHALSNAVVYEIYWTEIDPDDIVRDTVGGMTHDTDPKN